MIKTHTFKGRKYNIQFTGRIDGLTDIPGVHKEAVVMILDGKNFRAFHSAFHEALEASGFCNDCLHDKNGNFTTEDPARFLWRWIHERM